jgi:hypothetical protein
MYISYMLTILGPWCRGFPVFWKVHWLCHQDRSRDTSSLRNSGDYRVTFQKNRLVIKKFSMAINTLKFSSFGDIKSRTDNGWWLIQVKLESENWPFMCPQESLVSCMIKFIFTALNLLHLCHITAVYNLWAPYNFKNCYSYVLQILFC